VRPAVSVAAHKGPVGTLGGGGHRGREAAVRGFRPARQAHPGPWSATIRAGGPRRRGIGVGAPAALRAAAIRFAEKLGANGDSEDIVHDCTLWLIERQDFIKAPPTKAYFFTAVKRAVLERARGSYL
jgi:hypothetical protein